MDEVARDFLINSDAHDVGDLRTLVPRITRAEQRIKRGVMTHYIWLDGGDEPFTMSAKAILYPRNFREELYAGTRIATETYTNAEWNKIVVALAAFLEGMIQTESDYTGVVYWLQSWVGSSRGHTAEQWLNYGVKDGVEPITFPLQTEDLGFLFHQMQASVSDDHRVFSYYFDDRFYFQMRPFLAYLHLEHADMKQDDIQSALWSHDWTNIQKSARYGTGHPITARLWESPRGWRHDESV